MQAWGWGGSPPLPLVFLVVILGIFLLLQAHSWDSGRASHQLLGNS